MTLEELKRVCDEAAQGPWLAEQYTGIVRYKYKGRWEGIVCQRVHNDRSANFIAAARNCMPLLLAVVEAAYEVNDMYMCNAEYDLPTAMEHLDSALDALEKAISPSEQTNSGDEGPPCDR